MAALARLSASYQRRIQYSLSVSLQDIRAGGEALALWAMLALCFGYGVLHTLGPGHGKAVVVAYFLDSTRPRAWIEGLLAGGWIAFTHTVAALLLAGGVKLVGTFGLFGALAIWRIALKVGANFLFERPDAFWITPKKQSTALQAAE